MQQDIETILKQVHFDQSKRAQMAMPHAHKVSPGQPNTTPQKAPRKWVTVVCLIIGSWFTLISTLFLFQNKGLSLGELIIFAIGIWLFQKGLQRLQKAHR